MSKKNADKQHAEIKRKRQGVLKSATRTLTKKTNKWAALLRKGGK